MSKGGGFHGEQIMIQSSLICLVCPCCGEEIKLEIKTDADLVSAFSISADDLQEVLDLGDYEFGMEGGE